MRTIIELLQDIRPEADFKGSKNFIQDGLLDSFAIYKLLFMIETEFNIRIKGEDITPETLASIDSIKLMLEKYGIKQ